MRPTKKLHLRVEGGGRNRILFISPQLSVLSCVDGAKGFYLLFHLKEVILFKESYNFQWMEKGVEGKNQCSFRLRI